MTRKYDTETARLRELADMRAGEADGGRGGVLRKRRARRGVQVGGELRWRVEADRAAGECAQLKEKLETARGEYSARINEYMLQVGERRARSPPCCLWTQTRSMMLRPSHALTGGAGDGPGGARAAAAQPGRSTGPRRSSLHARLAANAGGTCARCTRVPPALRHRYEDVAPVVVTEDGEGRAAAAPHEDGILATR